MTHDGDRYDRLPPTPAERIREDQPSREGVLMYFADRFGMPPATFAGVSFWEKGRDKVWAFHGHHSSPLSVETLGMHLLRTDGRHWKPTTDGMQRFGRSATRNVVALDRCMCRRFWQGEDVAIDQDLDADPGYIVVANELAGTVEPLGVGLYLRGTIRSVVPKGRQRTIYP